MAIEFQDARDIDDLRDRTKRFYERVELHLGAFVTAVYESEQDVVRRQAPTRDRPLARELVLRPAVDLQGGIRAAVWMFDPGSDEFLCIFIPSGKLAWVPMSSMTIDPTCFVDGRKLLEKQAGAYPGELQLPDGEGEDDE